MKSVKTKIIVLVLSLVLFSSLVIGGTSMLSSRAVVEQDSTEIMNLLCENKTNNIDMLLKNTEESIKALSAYAIDKVTDVEDLRVSKDALDTYTQQVLDVALNTAKTRTGIATVYLRFDPSFGSTSGFLYALNSETKGFDKLMTTDLSLYEEGDVGHVGWFYQAYQSKTSIWMAPYMNENINKEIISYVTPMFVDHTFIGVIGMDIEFEALKKIVAETSIYESGYAYLTNDKAEIVYHQDMVPGTDLKVYNHAEFAEMAITLEDRLPQGKKLLTYTYEGIPKEATFRTLSNGMRFVVTAPKSEINAQANDLLRNMMITIIVILSIAIALTIMFTKRLIKPLLELNIVAKHIADGDLSVQVTHHSKDEVGMLAESFRQTLRNLQTYFTYIQELAYSDALTGIKNTTSYEEATKQYHQRIINGEDFHFAIIVFDINYLKDVNDTYGHSVGDEVIVQASKRIEETFAHSLIYRIGGDEFVALVEHEDYDRLEELLKQFDAHMLAESDGYMKGIRLSVAYGAAVYDTQVDTGYKSIFQRADQEMYKNKAIIKKIDGYVKP